MRWGVLLSIMPCVNVRMTENSCSRARDIDLQDREGETSVHVFLQNGGWENKLEERFIALLAIGASVEARNSRGMLPHQIKTKITHILYEALF
jgi:hypothetical protein